LNLVVHVVRYDPTGVVSGNLAYTAVRSLTTQIGYHRGHVGAGYCAWVPLCWVLPEKLVWEDIFLYEVFNPSGNDSVYALPFEPELLKAVYAALSVKGVGMGVLARAAASVEGDWMELRRIFAEEDVEALSRLKGLGKSKVEAISEKVWGGKKIKLPVKKPTNEDAVNGLANLGYPRGEAGKLVAEFLLANPGAGTEVIIKGVLSAPRN